MPGLVVRLAYVLLRVALGQQVRLEVVQVPGQGPGLVVAVVLGLGVDQALAALGCLVLSLAREALSRGLVGSRCALGLALAIGAAITDVPVAAAVFLAAFLSRRLP